MEQTPRKSLRELARKTGAFPEDAYHFVREGLSYAVERVHGPETPAQLAVMRYLLKNQLDLCDLRELYENEALTPSVTAAIQEAGGIEQLNRHVTGGEMSWGLRDYAQHRWGAMARLVLDAWRIRETLDFGRLVFAMIDYEILQKQPSDTLDDFRDVYDFEEALDQAYTISFDDCPSTATDGADDLHDSDDLHESDDLDDSDGDA